MVSREAVNLVGLSGLPLDLLANGLGILGTLLACLIEDALANCLLGSSTTKDVLAASLPGCIWMTLDIGSTAPQAWARVVQLHSQFNMK
jgi:hypothetical protein